MDNIEKFKDQATRLVNLYADKNADYGDSFSKTYDEFGLVSAITRMADKMNRIVSLTKRDSNEPKVASEQINDTLRDLASYAIMTLMKLEDKE